MSNIYICVCVCVYTHTYTNVYIYTYSPSKNTGVGCHFLLQGIFPAHIYVIYIHIYILHIIKIKNFCASKDVIKKVKQQPTEWKKIFTNSISYTCLIVSRIHKEHMYTYQCMYIHVYTQMYVLHLHMYTHTNTHSPLLDFIHHQCDETLIPSETKTYKQN